MELSYNKTWLIWNYNSKFCNNLNFSLNLPPNKEKFIQIYLVISKPLIRNLEEKFAL
jgi:hypothetical protein